MVKADTSIKIKEELEISRKNETLLASLLENSSQPFGVGYPDGHLGIVNKAFEELTGYSREELKSTDWSEVLTPHKFRDMENEKLDELQRTGQPVKYEKEYMRKDGTRVPIELLVHIEKNEDDTPKYYYSFITDISERKISEKLKHELLEKEQQLTEELTVSNEELQSTSEELQVTNEELMHQGDELLKINKALKVSQESYKNILDNLQDAYIRADKKGIITMVSPSAARMYRFDSPQEMIGMPAYSLYKYAEDRNSLIEKLNKYDNVEDFESTAMRKDGTSFLVSLNAQFHYDNNGLIQGTEAFVRDITERIEREKLSDALNIFNTKINSTLDYNEIMQLIVEEGAKAIGAESAIINLREQNRWIVKFVHNFPNNIIGQIKSDQESPTSIYVANKKEAIAFNDAPNDSRVNKNGMKLHGVASLLVAPIILKDEVRGVIAFYHHKKSVIFTKAQIDFTNKLASSLSQALENAELFENIKKSEELIKKNEKLLHTVLDNSLDGINMLDLETGSYNFMSPAQVKLTGFTTEEMNNFPVEEAYERVHPDDREISISQQKKVMNGEDLNEPVEYRWKVKSSEYRWFSDRRKLVYDEHDHPVALVGISRDINERKKVEEALNQSQKLLQDIINGFPSPIFVKDIEGRFLTINRKLEELLGVKNEEIKGKTDYDIITKELADYYKANDQKVLEEGKPISIEEEANLVDGHHTFIANKFPIYDNNNKLYGVGSVSTDITELKKTEENLKESEERLRLSQTLGNVGIWDWNTITDELHFTPELEQLYGLIPGTIKTYQDWRQLTHPDDIEKIEAERDDKIANQEPFDLEFRILHKSGQIHWLSAKGGAIYNDEGDILRVLGINIDITQRKNVEESLKESEERYHSLFDNNHAVMLLINPDNGDIIDANPAATSFYGYNYDELVKMNINNINVLSEDEIHDRMQKSVSSQQNNFLFKHRLASGEIRDVDVYSGTIVLGGKKLLYSIVHDVTDRVIAQDKLKESNEELERFAYVSSHDLQEPLRMVTSFTQLLERRYKGRLDNDADDYIGFIVDGAKRMKLLIDDLLTFSRLNTKPRENELVNLETALDTVLLNLKVSIEEKNVQITHDPLPTLYGDFSRKVQVFQNLISNAIKFNDKKITKIHISAKKEGNEWIFSVSDNGIGMDPKHLDRIFTIFQRLHTREKYEGTGIGLAIIQKIIQQQGGRIWVESEPGKGSTFYFTIPIKC